MLILNHAGGSRNISHPDRQTANFSPATTTDTSYSTNPYEISCCFSIGINLMPFAIYLSNDAPVIFNIISKAVLVDEVISRIV